MFIRCEEVVAPSDTIWEVRFAWLPVRTSAQGLTWLEFYKSRWVETCEGNWAGGQRGYREFPNGYRTKEREL